MIQALKSYIDRTTMFMLVLQYLIVLLVAALAASAAGFLPYALDAIIWSTVVLLISAWAWNEVLAWFFGAVTNNESSIITAIILALILPPVAFADTGGTIGLALIAIIAVASKYVIALWNKHIFNPVAFAVVISAFVFDMPAIWWIAGNLVMMPFVVIGGLIVVYKLRRFDLILAFFASALATISHTSTNPISGMQSAVLHSSIFFLAFAMLTEPLTMPPTRSRRIIYGALVGVFFAPAVHLGSLYSSPELALVVGNLLSFFMSPKGRYKLVLVERRVLAKGIYEFVFRSDRRIPFVSGQYLEWTLGGVPFDARGNRRFFTIASAPEKETISLGVRFYDSPSAFKRTLSSLPIGGTLFAASPAGNFTLPKNKNKKLAFIAGGVGVTPFASMARHCIASGESRDTILLYSNKTQEEIAYKEVFANASKVGWRTVYALSIIDAEFIKREVLDYNERLFYVSGSPGMVSAMKRTLLNLGISRSSIKTDYFPGLA